MERGRVSVAILVHHPDKREDMNKGKSGIKRYPVRALFNILVEAQFVVIRHDLKAVVVNQPSAVRQEICGVAISVVFVCVCTYV